MVGIRVLDKFRFRNDTDLAKKIIIIAVSMEFAFRAVRTVCERYVGSMTLKCFLVVFFWGRILYCLVLS